MNSFNDLYGLVVSGGNSSRMGFDKGSVIYYDKEQRYYLYKLLSQICSKVFISINKTQLNYINKEYNTLIDLPRYENCGPLAALLTAFRNYPLNNFLIVGCDYPYLSETELCQFLKSVNDIGEKNAAAFFNVKENLYEPLLGWYSSKSRLQLEKMYDENNYSLQYFLKTIDADKYIPHDERVIGSIDTQQDLDRVKSILNNKN